MDYINFKKSIVSNYGDFYSSQFEILFEKAVKNAENGNLKTSIKIAKDALFISKYSNIGYNRLYLIGLLCQVYLDCNQPEYANIYFKFGMKIIREKNFSDYKKHWDYVNSIDSNIPKYDFMKEVDSFLDLKIQIDKKLLSPI